jgi:trehalose synthase-fused probable maltokinase
MRTRQPRIRVLPGETWEDALAQGLAPAAAADLGERLRFLRWFRGKARQIAAIEVKDVVRVGRGKPGGAFVFLAVTYREGDPELYVLPLVPDAGTGGATGPGASLIEIEDRDGRRLGALSDGLTDPAFQALLLATIIRPERWRGAASEVTGAPEEAGRRLGRGADLPPPAAAAGEQSNTSVVYGEQAILKLYRRLEPGTNPDLEIGRYLDARGFRNVARVLGALEWRRGGETYTLGLLGEYVPRAVDGWRQALAACDRYLESARALGSGVAPPAAPPLLGGREPEATPAVREALGAYPEAVELLGRTTAELHIALASGATEPDFVPEPHTPASRRALHEAIETLARGVFALLRARFGELPADVQGQARAALAVEDQIRGRLQSFLAAPLASLRIRCHGDYHLGQVLHTGTDFIVLDFEGEPARPLGERRAKQSPLRDAAGMLRSFHYAAAAGLANRAPGPEPVTRLEPWARFWSASLARRFIEAYVARLASVPAFAWSPAELALLLEVHLLEKALYEIAYELNNRPDWVRIPLAGLLELVPAAPDRAPPA